LLLNANRLVTTDRLLEALYGEDLPATARSQVQIAISSLRRQFASRVRDTVIRTDAHGYVIRVADGKLDSVAFEKLCTTARSARESGNMSLAIATFREALRLWRGPALDGIESEFIRTAAARLDELRIAVTEDRVALELEAGRHHELVCELTTLVKEYPLREQLHAQLITALYRCGRIAEALQAYRKARRTFIDDLGLEPSEHLRWLEHAILTSDPSLNPPHWRTSLQVPERSVPDLLLADIADFTGRTDQINQIRDHLIHGNDNTRPIPVVVIMGHAGIGKTTLAIHIAHAVATHFRDGRLFAALHGSNSHPMSSAQVLERFLRALGTPGGLIPEGIDERAEIYRNLIADRKILVVLDDATSAAQILPLLPGSGSAAVIVTSRNPLASLAGALRVELDVFNASDSVDLLGKIAGLERVRAQPKAAAKVARYCGHLPLALRMAGARLAARSHWSFQQLADRLTDETRRLDELRHGEAGVRPSFSLTYDGTGERARQLFRRLALLEMPVFSGWMSAALLDERAEVAEELLEELVESRLIEAVGWPSGLPGKYRFHDLIRLYARERLADEEPAAQREAALERVLGGLLHLADEARRRHYGGDLYLLKCEVPRWTLPEPVVDTLVSQPLWWYDDARIALVSGVRQAAQAGFTQLCWNLAACAVPLFESKTYLDDWQQTHEIALEATRKARDARGQAVTLYHMGSLHITQLQLERARSEFDMAEELFREIGDPNGVAMVNRHIGTLDRTAGRLDEAENRYQLALNTFREGKDHIGVAYVMHGLAQVKLEENNPAEARELLSSALQLCREVKYDRLEAQLLHRTGEAYLMSGDFARATEAYNRALVIAKEIGDVIGESYTLLGLGVTNIRSGDLDASHHALQSALEMAVDIGERIVEARALLGLSELAFARQAPGEAVSIGQQAAALFRSLAAPLYEAQALALVNKVHATISAESPNG
jgi:DNA-binding SARP family transcriptional activator/predicted negative regulator of RcsB-dependent stress response